MNNTKKSFNLLWLIPIIGLPLLIIPFLIMVVIFVQVRGEQKYATLARKELTQLIEDANLDDNEDLCSYTITQSLLGSGAGTQHVTMVLLDSKSELLELNNALSSDGFRAIGYWDSASVHTSFEKNIPESREVAIDISYVESGQKAYADDDCSTSYKLRQNYVVPEGKTLAEIRYIVTKRQRL